MEETEVEQQVSDLDKRIERLQALYNQYFMGIEKLEPMVPRKQVDRLIYNLRKERIRHTALRFKFQTLIQRYNTLQTYWIRVCRQIEEGTYKRDVMRAQKRISSRETQETGDQAAAAEPNPEPRPEASMPSAAPEKPASILDVDDPFASEGPFTPSRPAPAAPTPAPLLDMDDPFGREPASRPKAPAPWKPDQPKPRPSESGLPDEERMKSVYKAYLTAKERTGEKVENLSFETLSKTLKKQAESVSAKHQNKQIDFKVVIREGKAVIKTVLKD